MAVQGQTAREWERGNGSPDLSGSEAALSTHTNVSRQVSKFCFCFQPCPPPRLHCLRPGGLQGELNTPGVPSAYPPAPTSLPVFFRTCTACVMGGRGKVLPIHGQDGIPHKEGLRLVSCQALEDLGDENRHLVLSAPGQAQKEEEIEAYIPTLASHNKAKLFLKVSTVSSPVLGSRSAGQRESQKKSLRIWGTNNT